MKSEPELRVNLRDADDYIRIGCGASEINGIITAYAKRAAALNKCYNAIKKQILQATNEQELQEISTDEMFLVEVVL